MKHTKKIMLSAIISILTIHGSAENLPGRTRNLNIMRIAENVFIQFIPIDKDGGDTIKDSGNILRDWAYYCDNPKLRIGTHIFVDPHPSMNKLGMIEKTGKNSSAKSLALNAYLLTKAAEVEYNISAFVDNNLKEMLSSRDQDGKTVSDILREKKAEGDLASIVLEDFINDLQEGLKLRGLEQNGRQELEEAVSKMIH